MIRLFQTYHPSVIGLLALVGIGLRVSYGFSALPVQATEAGGPLAQALFAAMDVLPGNAAFWSAALALLLALIQAFYLNHLVNNQRLTARQGFLPALSLLLVASAGTPFSMLSAPLVGSTFLLLALGQVVSLQDKEAQTMAVVLDAALLIAVAALFYLPYIYFTVFLVVALAFWVPLQARALLMILIGVAMPFYFLFVYYYWIGLAPAQWLRVLLQAWPAFSSVGMQYIPHLLLPAAAVGAVMLWSFFYVQANLFRMVIQVRLFLLTIILFFFCGLLMTVLHLQTIPLGLCWLLAPVAVALSLFLSEFRWRWLAEAYQLFLLAWALLFPYLFAI